ncbi:Hypothetical protein PFR_JS9-2_238 [Propionibacterium freudenreichii]|nr:Hypothetical protein PFR_JS2_219 [Propionibacterium freudenreichii]SCQ59596.1 Hypothetical protein PFR_JS9-1_240 [Propionibacterium freudenreichii]SCQ66338.1 Hypothetical protein PFR_JS9-2_238 [Propionibacterium freudenreichii]SCQ70243.1 Hypothetical protein PFR_JS20-1_213 [Propionibacterium freudenreichii]SCQ79179.1 Hypothetical protein PFR_JS20-2_213 [Propionibacterium freudenreichii]
MRLITTTIHLATNPAGPGTTHMSPATRTHILQETPLDGHLCGVIAAQLPTQ